MSIDYPAHKTIEETERKIEVKINVQTESQVIVHCRFTASNEDTLIRIWQSTFLYPKDSSHKSKLLHAINISLYPIWTIIEPNKTIHFTLIFSALPKNCTLFEMMEEIPESGGFRSGVIGRNIRDVYEVDLGG